RAGFQVRLRVLLLGEETRALEDDVRAERLPGKLLRILLGDDLDRLAGDRERAFRRRRALVRAAVDGVVVVEVCERLRIGEIVDGNDLDVFQTAAPLDERADDAATDAAETVDGNLLGHARERSRR